MKLYHGSKYIVDQPIAKGSKPDNDYGPAFYLTRDLKSAKEWACRNNSVGYVNVYEFNQRNLKVLDLTDKNKYSVLNWLAILLHYRELPSTYKNNFLKRLKFIEDNYYIDVKQYDLVIGYRADDAYFRFPTEFIVGNITLEQLDYSFQLGQLGIQYVVISNRAIKRLKFKEAILSEEKFVNCYFENVTLATKRFDKLDKDADGIRIMDLMKNNDLHIL